MTSRQLCSKEPAATFLHVSFQMILTEFKITVTQQEGPMVSLINGHGISRCYFTETMFLGRKRSSFVCTKRNTELSNSWMTSLLFSEKQEKVKGKKKIQQMEGEISWGHQHNLVKQPPLLSHFVVTTLRLS